MPPACVSAAPGDPYSKLIQSPQDALRQEAAGRAGSTGRQQRMSQGEARKEQCLALGLVPSTFRDRS